MSEAQAEGRERSQKAGRDGDAEIRGDEDKTKKKNKEEGGGVEKKGCHYGLYGLK